MERTGSQPASPRGRSFRTRKDKENPQENAAVVAVHSAKALTLLARARRAVERADFHAAEIEASAAVAEMSWADRYLREPSSP